MAFSTYDQDHSGRVSNCAALDQHGGGGAWWWKNGGCGLANLNGFNHGHAKKTSKSMGWYKFGSTWESLKTISMAIRPIIH